MVPADRDAPVAVRWRLCDTSQGASGRTGRIDTVIVSAQQFEAWNTAIQPRTSMKNRVSSAKDSASEIVAAMNAMMRGV